MRVRGLAAYVRTIPRIMRSSRHAKKASPVPAREVGTANVWRSAA
jgi:hypothetical protein